MHDPGADPAPARPYAPRAPSMTWGPRPRAALTFLALALALGLAAFAPASAPAPGGAPYAADRQILWQRSLDDALAIAKAESRPLLVAVNMDGESASERIVRERYRDPAFVAATRRFVCVIASAFRHSARDHDDEGRRIPCPRLGEVTCGEHIALEPILFDRYLGGERIAPRHALILPDGTKTFDLFLLFDLHDLDKKLIESEKLAPEAKAPSAPPALSGSPANSSSWAGLARAKDHLGRLAFERALLDLPAGPAGEPGAKAALGAISTSGDSGSVDALRILFERRSPPSPELLEKIAGAAEALHVEVPMGAAIRERIAGFGPQPGAPGLGDDEALLPILARLDGGSAASRSLLLAYAALGNDSESALASGGLAAKLAAADAQKVAAAIRAFPQRPDVDDWWRRVREVPTPAPAPAKPPEEKKTAEALEKELSDLDQALDARRDDVDLLARYGRATLELAQRRLESGGEGAQLLLQDADRFLDRAWQGGKRDTTLLFDRAKTAYLDARYPDEERVALAAESAARPTERIEALRWVGDAAARLLYSRSGADAGVETSGILRGASALAEVAASPTADETDWISLGSFLGALGMRREELAVDQLAAERFPASAAVRAAMNAALWAAGRVDLGVPKAEWLAARNPQSAEAAWHAGYARMLLGEDRRRAEDPDGAIVQYEKGSAWFKRCAELKPDYKSSADRQVALCALGRGFAHLLADRRGEAAKCLVEAISIQPAIASLRDGLDREPVDLLDGALEWRESGPSPVEIGRLLDSIEQGVPGDASWIRAVSDSELREALRADGRGAIVEGDRYLRESIAAARRAESASDDEDSRHTLAQPLAILAERLMARGDLDEAKVPLAEAARLLGQTAPAQDADAEAWKALAGSLREMLGEARPRFRPGR
jgi:hypothetical protein